MYNNSLFLTVYSFCFLNLFFVIVIVIIIIEDLNILNNKTKTYIYIYIMRRHDILQYNILPDLTFTSMIYIKY